MQAFVRRGFQLRTASRETKLAYTCFLGLMLPAIASLVALSLGRMGFSPEAIASHYRGGSSELSFPKTFWQLVETSHAHLFTIPVAVLVLSHLLYGTPVAPRVRLWLTRVAFTGAFLDIVGPWAVRYLAGGFAWPLLLGWVLLGGGLTVMVLLTLFGMWAPDSVLAALGPPSEEDLG